ncbi:MAG: hypothetical protein WDM89_03070 [Rhizomicrobium sp.]
MKSGSLLWFARHEARLAWRDVLSMLTAGRRERERRVLLGVLVFASFMHWVAYLALRGVSVAGIKADLPTLISVTAAMLLTGSALLSQAMENVTRVFYTRSDLELILSSPGACVHAVRRAHWRNRTVRQRHVAPGLWDRLWMSLLGVEACSGCRPTVRSSRYRCSQLLWPSC